MKLSELIKEVNKDLDDTVSTGDLIGWFNRCLDDITPIAKKEERKSTEFDGSYVFALPNDFHEMVAVEVDGTEYPYLMRTDKSNKGYKLWGNELTLQNSAESGEIDLYYYRKLARLVNPDDVPEIDESFHDLLILYAIGQAQFMDEDYDRPDSFNRYYQRKDEFARFMASKSNEVYSIQYID